MNTVQATKNKVTADNASIWTPILRNVPAVGSQFMELVKGCFNTPFGLIAQMKIAILINQETPAENIAREWLSLFDLLVNRTIKKKAIKGGTGTNQVNNS